MRTSIATALAVLMAMMIAGSVHAQSQNAADCYRIVAKLLPTAKDEAEQHVLANVLDAPLDGAVQSLLERGAKALDMFDVASGMPFGTWGFDMDEPMTAGRLLPSAAEMADLVALRARVLADEGRYAAALEEAYKLALLSRRLSAQPSYPRQLQQNAVFDRAAQVAGLVMPKVSSEELHDFTAKLNELRPAADLLDVLEAQERAYFLFHRRLVEDPYLRRIADEGIGPFASLFGSNLERVDVNDLVGDPDATQAAFAATEGAFNGMRDAMRLEPADRALAIAQMHVQMRFAHPLAKVATDMVDNCVRAAELNAASLEMLQTAIAICEDAKRPLDVERARGMAGRFQFEARDQSGFVLRWSDRGQIQPPMTLHVGPRPLRQRPTTAPSTRPQ